VGCGQSIISTDIQPRGARLTCRKRFDRPGVFRRVVTGEQVVNQNAADLKGLPQSLTQTSAPEELPEPRCRRPAVQFDIRWRRINAQ